MKIFVLIFVIIIRVSFGYAEIPQMPNQTLVSTAIGSLHTIDSFLVSASNGGVSLFVYDVTSQQYNFLNRIYIPSTDSITSKLEDSILIINSHDEKLHFISLYNLPEISYLGSVDLHRNFADFTLIDNSLYVAGFYDGILRYALTNYTQVTFIDSSMTGILVTQLDHDNQFLYALDEYNGVLRYDLSSSGFGVFDDYLFVPLRAFKYTIIDSLFYLHLIRGGFLVGDFNKASSDNIIDSLFGLSQFEYLYNSDSLLLLANSRELTTINKMDYTQRADYLLQDVRPNGLLYTLDDSHDLILPSSNGGLSFVTIGDTSVTLQDGLAYNGLINDMVIDKSNLYLSNSKEPLNSYRINFAGFTSYNYSLYDNLKNTGQLQNNGDSLFVIYPEFEKLAVIVHADKPDSALLENSISISSSPVKNMYFNGEQLYDNALIFVEHPFRFDLYAVSDSGYLSFEKEWKFIADMTSFSFKDSIAVLTNRKNECAVYRILQDFDKQLIKTFSLGTTATESIFYGDRFFLFAGKELLVFDFTDPVNSFIDTVLSIPIDVLDAVIVEDYMFTVGNQGIMKFDLTGALPALLEIGGLPGNAIAVDSNVIAIHDNQTVMLYYHELTLTGRNNINQENSYIDLFQNYPNPFNLETVIKYSLAQNSKIKITVYNILGQNIKTLVDTNQEAGIHTVTWDGTTSNGNVVASGIYLYKLETANSVSSKKMILLK